MVAEEMKAFFKKIWDCKVIILATMMITGILDLIGITSKWEIGLGFVLGFLGFFILAIVTIARKSKSKKEIKE